ncbi:hypothetical protein BKA61DRAFT_621421 [Leptodontidium sp. MPI-SDFR-AT-0119]|nr:hypothetical protein BKA61DRAFT_621421 [Leptodontidium sp. MPI-SDFR-AT-0119]
MKVNIAFLTPTVSRLIVPSHVLSLETIVLTGESGNRADFAQWAHLSKVLNGYGPTECTMCTLHQVSGKAESGACIGTAVGSVCWVVVPEQDDRLVGLRYEVYEKSPLFILHFI